MPYGRISLDSAAEAESTRPFDGLDKLTASKLKAPSRFDKLKAPSESRGKVEGLTFAATRNRSLNCGIQGKSAGVMSHSLPRKRRRDAGNLLAQYQHLDRTLGSSQALSSTWIS